MLSGQRFDFWRAHARSLIFKRCPPSPFLWTSYSNVLDDSNQEPDKATFVVPAQFMNRARIVSAFSDARAPMVLYSILWRLLSGERRLLDNPLDPDVIELERMEKAVRRDLHKMHAFVRFKQVGEQANAEFCAWHKPDHLILDLATSFFRKRFGRMCWTLMTPSASARWDGSNITYFDGVQQKPLVVDAMEENWKAYYASIFNPARLKVRAMKKEMPTRHWPTLPESTLIPDLIIQAKERVRTMELAAKVGSISLPPLPLDELRKKAACCVACPLYSAATQIVFGQGNSNARIVLVGEQPGDEEDKTGTPFVGPAGKILDDALAAAGIDRDSLYITNAVKHFKWELRGKRRLHVRPSGDEIVACKAWLVAELGWIRPSVIVCLGSSAAQSVLGRTVRIKQASDHTWLYESFATVLVTYHPSAILRAPDEASRRDYFSALVSSLQSARQKCDLVAATHSPAQVASIFES